MSRPPSVEAKAFVPRQRSRFLHRQEAWVPTEGKDKDTMVGMMKWKVMG